MSLGKTTPIYQFSASQVLPGFDGEGEGSGAGAGGAGAGAAITREEITGLINTAVNTTVNGAIATLKRVDLPKIIETSLAPVTLQFTSVNESLAKLLEGQNGGGNGGGSGAGNGGGNGGGSGSGIPPEVNATLKRLEETVKNQGGTITKLQTDRDDANKRAEAAETNSTVKTALGEMKFASASAAQTAFSIVSPHIKRLEDGTVVAGDNLPVLDFIKDFLPKEHAYLLAPTGNGGSGAGGGSQGGGQRGGAAKGDISMIKADMKPEDRAAVVRSIGEALQHQ